LTFESPEFSNNFHFYRMFKKLHSTEAAEKSLLFSIYIKRATNSVRLVTIIKLFDNIE